jgi:hypothetical protein
LACAKALTELATDIPSARAIATSLPFDISLSFAARNLISACARPRTDEAASSRHHALRLSTSRDL